MAAEQSASPNTAPKEALTMRTLFARSIALMKPVTWFPPTIAFICGTIASGTTKFEFTTVSQIALGALMAGPILCGLSQVINEYCDREVDAINEPQRPIPAGLVTHRHVFVTIAVLTIIGLAMSLFFGMQVVYITLVGMLFAVMYSAEPFRAKKLGWIGNALVSISYEGLPWVAGHLAFAQMTGGSLLLAGLYSLGAHGIMTINDFKSIEGDRMMGIKSIPAQMGANWAAMSAVVTINIALVMAIIYMYTSGHTVSAIIMFLLALGQIPTQRKFLQMTDPRARAIYYNASGVMIFVLCMIVSAVGIRS
ncbi:MAG: chlorophyll synthase ChlG [Chloroflexi bacterium]|jgi:chlorophyll/bacteriochlorophyll a synthase|nr:MAG: chlorophyll synthase ChlG [Chloroflexota bacterium]